jgi:hypothetical protein
LENSFQLSNLWPLGFLCVENLCFFATIELLMDYVRFSNKLKTEAPLQRGSHEKQIFPTGRNNPTDFFISWVVSIRWA